jgi:acyl-CoA synthetase (AMP-forming)/AMP-acid ligase II/acetyltransferase-like isoleucine patch superfamily enzyme/acyl carrier protein
VAVVLPNGPEMASAFVAVASGAACAPLNPAYKAEEFDFYLSDLGARALITADLNSPAVAVARRRGVAVLELRPGAAAGVFELAGGDNPSGESGGGLDWSRPEDTALVLHTSGTTSRPKIVPLSQANLCASAANIAGTLALGPEDRCLNVMPLFHIHGLMAALLGSLNAGASVICSPGYEAAKFFTWLDEMHPTWYTAVPTIHQAVLAQAAAHREIIQRRPLRFIRSSSSALPPQVLEDLEQAFGTRVIEAYGMTEAAHQMASNPLPPLPRKPGSVGMAAGPRVSVMDADGNLLKPGETGEVVIAGSNVTAGYESNPEANRSAFTNGWFRTGDQGRFDEDGYLYLTGRLKEIINRGGEKIAPREVDDVLMQHPAVAQAVTFAVPHPTLGEEVAAAVVLKEGASASPAEIRDAAAAQLADFKLPKQVLILDAIPKGATGKIQRIGLAEKLAGALAAQRQEGFVAAGSDLEQQLIDIWSRLLKVERVGVKDDFRTLGGDSLSMTQMIVEVERLFDRQIPIDAFLRNPTIEGLVAIHAGEAADTAKRVPLVQDGLWSGMRNRVCQLLALYAPGNKTLRVWLHRKRGVAIGDNVSIGLSTLIESAYPQLVSIGRNASIGTRVVIIGHLRDSTDAARMEARQTVHIEDEAYIGPGVIILPNVIIGQGAVVSAGSVVSRSIPPRVLAQGNPAVPVAKCGVSLGGGVSYEKFLRHLTPLEGSQPREAAEKKGS